MMLIPTLDNTYDKMAPSTALIAFIVVLGALLLTMGTYRSPAVALMPDVTTKTRAQQGQRGHQPHGRGRRRVYTRRHQDAGGEGRKRRADYLYLFLAVAVLMVLAALTVLFFVPERKLVQQMKDINYGVSEAEDQSKSIVVDGKQKASSGCHAQFGHDSCDHHALVFRLQCRDHRV